MDRIEDKRSGILAADDFEQSELIGAQAEAGRGASTRA